MSKPAPEEVTPLLLSPSCWVTSSFIVIITREQISSKPTARWAPGGHGTARACSSCVGCELLGCHCRSLWLAQQVPVSTADPRMPWWLHVGIRMALLGSSTAVGSLEPRAPSCRHELDKAAQRTTPAPQKPPHKHTSLGFASFIGGESSHH